MKGVTLFVLLIILLIAGQACGSGPACRDCDCAHGNGTCAPAGGWFPYGGGLVHWLPCCCFPTCGSPDDYCRKPLPCLCWPAYPSYFIYDQACNPTCTSTVNE